MSNYISEVQWWETNQENTHRALFRSKERLIIHRVLSRVLVNLNRVFLIWNATPENFKTYIILLLRSQWEELYQKSSHEKLTWKAHTTFLLFWSKERFSLSHTSSPPLFFSLPYLMFHLSHLCGVNCSVELQRSQDSGGSIRRWWWPWSDPSLLHVLFKRDVAMRLIRNEVWVIRGFFFSYFFYLSPGCFPCLVFVLVWFS